MDYRTHKGMNINWMVLQHILEGAQLQHFGHCCNLCHGSSVCVFSELMVDRTVYIADIYCGNPEQFYTFQQTALFWKC